MSFLSPEFFFFLIAFFLGATYLTGKTRVWFYTVMSYLFYSTAYLPYVLLLLLITLLNYYVGLGVDTLKNNRIRKILIVSGVGGSLAVLGYYKYSNWLLLSILNCFAITDAGIVQHVPDPPLPVGISFFTFQALSYSIDVYRRQTPVCKSLVDFVCFVSFFPQLVAGPIVRSREFLPQIPVHKPLQRDNTIRGIELVLIGYFKKCVIADNLSPLADSIFNYPQLDSVGGALIWFGVLCFSVQIYCDFSGYSDIARGLGRITGFHIPVNFRWPYLSCSIREFWQRWHITLSYWIRDYIYIPMGGGRVLPGRYLVNVLVTWFLCGLWHGASFNFVLWGFYHGFLVCSAHFIRKTRAVQFWLRIPVLLQISITFLFVMIGWVFFRAQDIRTVKVMLVKMFLPAHNYFLGWEYFLMPLTMILTAGLIHMVCYHNRYDVDKKSILLACPYLLRMLLVVSTIILIILFAGQQEAFIYFAF